MPSDRIAKCFRDMVSAIDLIGTWVEEAGGSDNAVDHDLKSRSAIERQLLIISEAAVRLDKLDPTALPRLAPNIDWPGIRGIGNFIRHKYDEHGQVDPGRRHPHSPGRAAVGLSDCA